MGIVLGRSAAKAYNTTNTTDVVSKITTATDKTTRQTKERDLRLPDENEISSSLTNCCIWKMLKLLIKARQGFVESSEMLNRTGV